MIRDSAFEDLKEQQALSRESNNEVVVFTDFKDWLMGETAAYVQGEND